MEALSLGTIVVVLVVVWYLGSSINAIISKAGVMAEDEFTQFRRAQKFRISKDNQDLKVKVKTMSKEQVMTDAELDEALGLS